MLLYSLVGEVVCCCTHSLVRWYVVVLMLVIGMLHCAHSLVRWYVVVLTHMVSWYVVVLTRW